MKLKKLLIGAVFIILAYACIIRNPKDYLNPYTITLEFTDSILWFLLGIMCATIGTVLITLWRFRIEIKNIKFQRQWYNNGNMRIHDYFSFMINQFPILVIRKYDNPGAQNRYMFRRVTVGFFGFSWTSKNLI